MKTAFFRVAKVALLAATALLTACAAGWGYDTAPFREAKPRSILIMPPVNNSNDINGSNSLWSLMSLPLGEAGYYVLPVALVDETFRQNGVNNPVEAANLPAAKLRQIYGADAALYTTITAYGTTFLVVTSSTVVTAESKLVDLRTGKVLWQGSASANSGEINNGRVGAGGSIVAMVVSAVVNQVIESTTDVPHKVAGLTSVRLLAAGPQKGLVYGPRSPYYDKQ